MEEHIVKITNITKITHDVVQIRVTKPDSYNFTPGQATEVSINNKDWKEEKRPFTFTALPNQPSLEFTIKIYPDHHGVTNEIGNLKPGDELIIRDVWGAIQYKGEGLFIAGGAGITPFLAILRWLKSENRIGKNKLIFANKTKADIIHQDELSSLLGSNMINILSEEQNPGYEYGHINKELIQKNLNAENKYIYVCGPPPMMDAVQNYLNEIGIGKDAIVLEV